MNPSHRESREEKEEMSEAAMQPLEIADKEENADFAGLRYVSLRLLWDCNLRCIMCDHPHRPRSEMPVEMVHRVLNQLTHRVRLTFIGGEPCLWLIQHQEVLRRAIESDHTIHLITNGTLIPRLPDFVNAFRDRPVSAQFSIDGFGNTYERIRKRSSWDLVVNAIRLLQARRTEGRNKQAFITTNYLLMRSTLDDLPQFIQFCAQEGVDAVSLTYTMIYDSMVSMGEITEDESVYYHKEATNNAIHLAIDVAQREGLSLSYPPLLGVSSVFGRQWEGPEVASTAPGKSLLPKTEQLVCDKPWKEIFVNQDGTIVPCCCGPGIGPVIGHIDDGLRSLWNDDRVKGVRRLLAQGEFHKDCRCGINISAVGRQTGPEHFFTRLRNNLGAAKSKMHLE